MRLLAAARHFDRLECLDGYSGDLLFKAQLGLYDDNKRDSETAERRVLSVAGGVDLPTRRVVQAAGTRWILGHANPDDFAGHVVRVGYVAQEATYLSQIRTLSEVCLSLPGFTAYAGRAWVKNMAFSQQGSKLVPQYHLHFAAGEPVGEDLVASFEGRLNLIRAVESGPGGTLVATCEEIPEPAIETGTLTAGTFDPVTETLSGTPQAVRLLRLRWQSLFAYRNNLTPTFGPGDIQVAISKASATVAAGAQLTLSDGVWTIASALDEGAVWLCRACLHG